MERDKTIQQFHSSLEYQRNQTQQFKNLEQVYKQKLSLMQNSINSLQLVLRDQNKQQQQQQSNSSM